MDQLNELKKEKELLINFVSSNINKNSIIYNKLQNVISEIDSEIKLLDLSNNKNVNDLPIKQDMITLRISYMNKKQLLVNIQSTFTTTIHQLKNMIEDQIINELGMKRTIDRIHVRRTGKIWSSASEKTLHECDIHDNEDLLIDLHTSSMNANTNNIHTSSMVDIIDIDDLNANILSRLNQSNMIPRSTFELLSLVIHSFMLDEGFIALIELPNSVPGFAPSIKEIPKDSFIPSNWKVGVEEASRIISIMYKHKTKPGKYFVMDISQKPSLNEMIYVAINERKTNNIYNFEFNSNNYMNSSNISNSNDQVFHELDRNCKLSSLIKDAEEIKNNFQIFLYSNKIIPGIIPNKLNVIPPEGKEDSTMMYTVESPPPQDLFIEKSLQHISKSFSTHPPGLSTNYYDISSNRVVGNADLDPFPHGIYIGPQGGHNIPSIPLGPLPGTGSYVGPDHPMFQPDYQFDPNNNNHNSDRNIFDFIPPEYLPQARFDPYGPVLGPNNRDLGVDVGNVGVDHRGRRIIDPLSGRGRGSQPGGRNIPGRGRIYPGEPNPDHFKPPGW